MKKCKQCNLPKPEECITDEHRLWLEMVESMKQFTGASSVLMRNMQGKLGILPPGVAKENKFDACDVLDRLQKQLAEINVIQVSVCKCTTPPIGIDNTSSNEDFLTGIEIHQSPRIIKKRKFRYSTDLQSKILAKKKNAPGPCQCSGQEGSVNVDSCICGELPKLALIKDKTFKESCSILVCSDLEGREVKNITCTGDPPQEKPAPTELFGNTEDTKERIRNPSEHNDVPQTSPQPQITEPVSSPQPVTEKENDPNDPLAWIRKPGSFEPDKLPQDDTHPLIIKTEDSFRISQELLGTELFNRMKNSGKKIAQIDTSSGEQLTYDEMLEKCIKVAENLKKELSDDDIVGLCTSNHKDRSIPYIAAIFNGNKVAAFDRTMTKEELTHCLRNVTPKIMFVCSNSVKLIEECMQESGIGTKLVLFGDDGNHVTYSSYLEGDIADGFEPNKAGSQEDTVVISFTGGIANLPKAVCLSHYGLLKQSLQMIEYDNQLPVTLNFSELGRISAVIILFYCIFGGGTRIVVENFEVNKIWNLLEKYQVNALYLHPHQCIELSTLDEPEEDISPLFCIFTGGERLPNKTISNLRELIPGALLNQAYGLTEVSGVNTIFKERQVEDHILLNFKSNSCGKPIDGIWYKVVDTETGKIKGPLEKGELFVKTKMLCNGYLENNKECKSNKSDWFRTGDMVYYDAYDCFYLLGRIENLTKYRNKTLIPSEIEGVLMSHPSVKDAAVIGIEQPIGLVVLDPKGSAQPAEIEEYLRKNVSVGEEWQGGVKIIESIPYSGCGKISRLALSTQYSS